MVYNGRQARANKSVMLSITAFEAWTLTKAWYFPVNSYAEFPQTQLALTILASDLGTGFVFEMKLWS